MCIRDSHETVGDGVGDDPGQQSHRADGVVVTRDLVVDLVGVTVGVEDRDDRQTELASLVDSQVLFLRVDDPHGRRDPSHRADAAEGLLKLVLLALEDEQFLLRVARTGHVVEVDLLKLLEALQPLGDGREVGEHAAEPTAVSYTHLDVYKRQTLGSAV